MDHSAQMQSFLHRRAGAPNSCRVSWPDFRNGNRAAFGTDAKSRGASLPAYLTHLQINYRLILRRIPPTAPINPVPSSNRLEGSGVAVPLLKLTSPTMTQGWPFVWK